MKLLFIGVEYFSGEAYLIFDDVFGNGARIRQRLANHQISFARKASRFCSGWYDLRDLISNPCSQKNRVLGDSPRCADCENRTGYSPFFYNTSRVSDAQRSYNAEPHIVYLASFSPDTIKVGITNARRKLNRWLDQGAIYVRELTLLENAEDARSMEKFISSTIQVPEAVSYKKSFRCLYKMDVVIILMKFFSRL